MTSEAWTIRYAPKSAKEVQGQDKALSSLKVFLSNYKRQKKRAALLYGAPGSGKTCSVYAIAAELDLEVLEINASDFRNKSKIDEKLEPATKQMSLFAKGKVILVDEVDGLSGTKDRGGLQEVLKIIEDSAWPIVMTITDPYDQKFSKLRKKSEMIEFHTLNYLSVNNVLKKICESEKIKYDENVLKALARRSGGDMRGAINDLFTITQNKKEVKKESLDDLGERRHTENITQALLKVFKTTQADIAIGAYDNVDEDFDKIFLWLDENLAKEYKNPEDLYRAYDNISRADVFKGRIRRWQYWRFLVYINSLLSVGVATAKDEKYKDFVKYAPTTRILKLWQANMKYQKRKAIAEKISEKGHSSKRRIIQNMPYIKAMFKNKEMAKNISEEFELDEGEIEWLKK